LLPLEDLYTEVATLLAGAAPSQIQEKELARNEVCPLYVWVPRTATLEDVVQTTESGFSLGNLVREVDIHCWGETMTQAERLWQALVTAIDQALCRKNFLVRDAEYVPPGDTTNGFKIISTIAFESPMLRAVLPALLGDPIVDATPARVTITSTDLRQQAGTAGDGHIDYGET
jgi:hypothetical protein